MKRSSLILTSFYPHSSLMAGDLNYPLKILILVTVKLGETCSETVQLVNEGEEHLFVDSVDFYGSRAFEVISQCISFWLPEMSAILLLNLLPIIKESSRDELKLNPVKVILSTSTSKALLNKK